MKDILEKLKVDFIYATGAKYIGIIKTIGVTFASRLSEFTDKLKFIEKNRFITTADKEYLYLHGGGLIEPLVAKRAEGQIEVIGTVGVVITAGLIMVSDSIEYEVVETETVADNGKAIVKVEAVYAGEIANRSQNEIIRFKTIQSGLNGEARVIEIRGGTNDETESEYRKRVADFIRKPQAPFNKNNITYVLKKENGNIKYVWVIGGERHIGKVEIFMIDYSYELSQDYQDRAWAVIDEIKPPQLRNIDIEIKAPIVESVDVVVENVQPQATKVYEAIKRNIEELFGEDNFEKGVSQKDIERAIYAVSIEGTRVEDFTITTGVTSGAINTVFKLNTVSVS